MIKWDLEKIFKLLAQCSEIANDYANDLHVELKKDKSIVTIADKKIEKLFINEYDKPEKGNYVIGEESIGIKSEHYIQNAFKGSTIIIDPIDGTAPYVAGVPLWGTSIALMQNGVITEGLIYIPNEDTATFSLAGELWQATSIANGNVKMEKFQPNINDVDMLNSSIGMAQYCAKNWKILFNNQLFVWSACVISYHCLLRGRLGAYVQHCKLWDVAAALKLLELAKIVMLSESGEVINCNVLEQNFFNLNATQKRWCAKEIAVVSSNEKFIDYIWKNCNKD